MSGKNKLYHRRDLVFVSVTWNVLGKERMLMELSADVDSEKARGE